MSNRMEECSRKMVQHNRRHNGLISWRLPPASLLATERNYVDLHDQLETGVEDFWCVPGWNRQGRHIQARQAWMSTILIGLIASFRSIWTCWPRLTLYGSGWSWSSLTKTLVGLQRWNGSNQDTSGWIFERCGVKLDCKCYFEEQVHQNLKNVLFSRLCLSMWCNIHFPIHQITTKLIDNNYINLPHSVYLQLLSVGGSCPQYSEYCQAALNSDEIKKEEDENQVWLGVV